MTLAELKQLLADQAYTQKELDQAEELWMEASEEYEALSKNSQHG